MAKARGPIRWFGLLSRCHGGPQIRLGSPSPKINRCSSGIIPKGKDRFNWSNEGKDISGKCGNKVMVVVDSSLEAKEALEWALSHMVQIQDTLVLLHVMKPAEIDSNGKLNPRARELLHSMKNISETIRPRVQVEVSLLEGKKTGPIIVEEANRQKASLLIIGQRKPTVMWQLIWQRTGRSLHAGRAVEYCIQNANCMTIAVRRKSKKHGGYLITTKRHKNFWLLA